MNLHVVYFTRIWIGHKYKPAGFPIITLIYSLTKKYICERHVQTEFLYHPTLIPVLRDSCVLLQANDLFLCILFTPSILTRPHSLSSSRRGPYIPKGTLQNPSQSTDMYLLICRLHSGFGVSELWHQLVQEDHLQPEHKD